VRPSGKDPGFELTYGLHPPLAAGEHNHYGGRLMGKKPAVTSFKVGMALCLALSLLLATGGKAVMAADTIKIGAITSLTGPFGFLGTSSKECLEIGVEQINAKGGVLGRQIEVLFEDDQSNPTNSVIAATKLIRDKKVVAVIAPSFTAGCMSVIPICEQEQVPMLSPAPANAPFSKWVFNILINDVIHGPGMLKFMAETLKAKKIAILTGDESGFLAGVQSLESQIGKYGVTVVAKEQYKLSDTNMVAQLTKIKAAQPDAILFYGIATGASVAAKNYVQLGMTQPVVCSWGVASKDFARLTGDTLLKGKPWIIFGTKFNFGDKLAPNDPYRKNFDPFVKAYEAKWKHEAASYGTNAWDALNVICLGIESAKSDNRAAVRDAIEKVKFLGLQGPFSVTTTDHYGMKVESVLPMVVKDGHYYPYEAK
jgi:branched-chain amino acid transport system substrate-binding protein